MEKLVIDFAIRKKEDIPKRYSPGTGREISPLWENLEKSLGIYWFSILKIQEENPDKPIIIKNLDHNLIPLAVYFNLDIDLDSIKMEQNNILNNISPPDLYWWALQCKEKGTLRDLVEMVSCSSVKLADLVYQLDFTGKTKDSIPEGHILQNSWQAYGRSYIRDFHRKILRNKEYKNKCMLIPCTKGRPYYSKGAVCSFAGREDFKKYFGDSSYEKIVMSNIGLVPEKYWEEDLILKYLAGVPDLGRIYQLSREFFTRYKFGEIVSFVEYSPYIEILEILEKMLGIKVNYFIQKKYRMKGAKFAVKNLV